MCEVIDINEARARKKEKDSKSKTKTSSNSGPNHYPYTGKLGEAMRKYGSGTGNVMKDQHKKKEKVGEDENV